MMKTTIKKGNGTAGKSTSGSTVSISQGTLTALNNLASLFFVISEREKKVSGIVVHDDGLLSNLERLLFCRLK